MGTQLSLSQKGTAPPPIFGPYPLRPNGCIDQDDTWYGGRPQPRRLCLRYRDSATPPQKRGSPPPKKIQPMFIVAKRLMDEDASWYGSRPQPRPHCTRRAPSYARNGHSSPHLFGPCLLWPRSPISATTELLLHILRHIIWISALQSAIL